MPSELNDLAIEEKNAQDFKLKSMFEAEAQEFSENDRMDLEKIRIMLKEKAEAKDNAIINNAGSRLDIFTRKSIAAFSLAISVILIAVAVFYSQDQNVNPFDSGNNNNIASANIEKLFDDDQEIHDFTLMLAEVVLAERNEDLEQYLVSDNSDYSNLLGLGSSEESYDNSALEYDLLDSSDDWL